jgi:3-oxoacyl-[acyl-carrier protein] reductase
MSALTGKTAVVTGAGRGIGRAIAVELGRQGASVLVNSHTSANAEAAAEAVRQAGAAAEPFAGSVAESAVVDAMLSRALELWGRIDILVNNAGITRDGLVMRMKDEDWDAVLNTNLRSAFLCIRGAARTMLKQKSGRIINITSVMGIVGNAGQANYAASKGGLIALTKSCAKELGSRGITVNAVAPGFIQTDMTDVLPDEMREQVTKQVPLARLGHTRDIASLVAFLAADDASYITGQVISVDGGLFM